MSTNARTTLALDGPNGFHYDTTQNFLGLSDSKLAQVFDHFAGVFAQLPKNGKGDFTITVGISLTDSNGVAVELPKGVTSLASIKCNYDDMLKAERMMLKENDSLLTKLDKTKGPKDAVGQPAKTGKP
jgi:hypothetical protein